MKFLFLISILLITGCSCDDKQRRHTTTNRDYQEDNYHESRPQGGTTIINNGSQGSNGLGGFVAGALIGSALSGNNGGRDTHTQTIVKEKTIIKEKYKKRKPSKKKKVKRKKPRRKNKVKLERKR